MGEESTLALVQSKHSEHAYPVKTRGKIPLHCLMHRTTLNKKHIFWALLWKD